MFKDKIIKGTVNEYIDRLLSERTPFERERMEKNNELLCDWDPVYHQLRKNDYLKKMEMIHKFGEEKEGDTPLLNGETFNQFYQNGEYLMVWNTAICPQQYKIPDEILNCI